MASEEKMENGLKEVNEDKSLDAVQGALPEFHSKPKVGEMCPNPPVKAQVAVYMPEKDFDRTEDVSDRNCGLAAVETFSTSTGIKDNGMDRSDDLSIKAVSLSKPSSSLSGIETEVFGYDQAIDVVEHQTESIYKSGERSQDQKRTNTHEDNLTLPSYKAVYSTLLQGAGDALMKVDTEKAFDHVASATLKLIDGDNRSNEDMCNGQLPVEKAALHFVKEQEVKSLKMWENIAMKDDDEQTFNEGDAAIFEFLCGTENRSSKNSKETSDFKKEGANASMENVKDELCDLGEAEHDFVDGNNDGNQKRQNTVKNLSLEFEGARRNRFVRNRNNRNRKNRKATSDLEKGRAGVSINVKEQHYCLGEGKNIFVHGSNDDNQKRQNTVPDIYLQFDEARSNRSVRKPHDPIEDAIRLGKLVADLDISGKIHGDVNSIIKKEIKRLKKSPRNKPSSRCIEVVTIIEVACAENSRTFDERPMTRSKEVENFAKVGSSSDVSATQRIYICREAPYSDSEWAAMLENKRYMTEVYEVCKRHLLDELKDMDKDIDHAKSIMKNPTSRRKFRVMDYVSDKLSYLDTLFNNAKQSVAERRETLDKAYPVNFHPNDDKRVRALYEAHNVEFEAFIKYVTDLANQMRVKCFNLLK